MKRFLAALVIGLAVLVWHADVHAACTTSVVLLPGGRTLICTTCCNPGEVCTTVCV